MHIKALLGERIEQAFATLGLEGPAVVQVAARPEYGDYQANGVMAAAKRAGRNPREVAGEVLSKVQLDDIASALEIAGPGFINITLKPEFLAANQAGAVTPSPMPATIVVDYSAPNLAKEMHAGHLRGTSIGDCLVRVLEAQGHHVIRQNHVGDWGTQFGMLITYLRESGEQSDELQDLERFYVSAKQRFDDDAQFQTQARQAVVDLQRGDEQTMAFWQRFIDISMSHCQAIYDRLGITLKPADTRGESAYNPMLDGVIEQLQQQGLLQESDGAQCVFLPQFKNKKGDIQPIIVQKSDGGYLYATTDLAAVEYRTASLEAQRVLYITDARQALHFEQLFALSHAAGFNQNNARLEHLAHGSVLGLDGKPYKTRDGGVVKLAALLDEAQLRATTLVAEKNPDLDAAEAQTLGRRIGIGAIKYAELSKNRTSDYIFDMAQMITFDGNTAPYLQYAYTRIISLFERGAVDATRLPSQVVTEGEEERRLAVALAGFDDVLEQVAAEGYPHYLCGHLYEVATRFTTFYEACPILKADDDATRQRRLALAHQTATTLRAGLELLGIEVVERM